MPEFNRLAQGIGCFTRPLERFNTGDGRFGELTSILCRKGVLAMHYVCGAIIMAALLYSLFFTDAWDSCIN